MADYNTRQDNLDQLDRLEESDSEITVDRNALSDMYELVQMCDEYDLPQPEIYPWSEGHGIQAEWNYEWYIEVGSDGHKICFYVSNENSDIGSVECSFDSISNAIQFLRLMFAYAIDQ